MSSKTRLSTGVRQTVTPPIIPVAPAAPTGFVANPDLTSVALDWNNNTELDLASYKVYQLISSTWTLVHTVTAPTSLYTVTGLSSSTQYSFRVTAFSTSALESAPSAILTVTTDAATTGSTLATLDRTGTLDIADALEAWVNDNANVPNGTGAATPHRVKVPQFQADGVTRAIYRNEGGVSGGVNLGNMTDVTFDGGGKIGGDGQDGAQFISKTKNPFVIQADPILNDHGSHHHDGNTTAVPAWSNTKTYALNAIITPGNGRRYQSRLAANLGHDPTDTVNGPKWWKNISADGVLTANGFDFAAGGVVVGDQIEIYPLGNSGSDPTVGQFTTRTVSGINVGGNAKTITYAGSSVGAFGGNNVAYTINPNSQWNAQYTPTDATNVSYTGHNANGSAYLQAKARVDSLNRSRTMFIMSKVTRVRFRGFQFTGSYDFVFDPTLNTTGYDPNVEAQDAFQFRGVNDCEIGDVTIEKFWGNGIEFQQYNENDGSLTPTRGVWVHDSKFQNFGRQTMSLTFGYNATIEDTYLGESSRSLIDCEPTTSRIGTGTNPVLQWTMQDVHLLRCQIGYHHLGMLSAHEGLGRVHVDACTGRGIGTSGVATVDKLIWENCIETPSDISTYSFVFDPGPSKGGDSIIVRNNSGMTARLAGVHFNRDNRPCSNFQVSGNLFGTGVPQFADDGGTNGLPFTPFTLPVPAHALRDLVVTPPVAPPAPTGFTANPAVTSVALDWNTSPEPDLASYNVYRLISSTWTLIHTVTAPTSAYTVTGLSASTSYSFRVTAVDSGGLESTPSSTVTVTTDPAGLTDIPTVTNVIFGNKAAFVTWQKPASGVTVSSYVVSCIGQSDITVAPKAGTWQKAVIRNLLMGNSYTVTIKAVTAGGTNPAAPITGTVVWKRPETLTPAGDCITGVAAHGLTLTTYGGSLTLTAGTYDGFVFNGEVTIGAAGVIITRSKIVTGLVGTDGTGANGIFCGSSGAFGAVLEDVEIDGSNPSNSVAAGAETGITSWGGSTSVPHPLICRRVNVHGCKSVNLTGGNTTMEYCYCWDIRNTPGNHADGIQIYNGSNYSLVGNEVNFDVTKGNTNGLVNAALFLQSSQGAIGNVTIDGNLFFGGESTVQLNPRSAGAMTNVSLINNLWRRNPLPGGVTNPLGGYGPNGEVAGGNSPLYLNAFTWAANGGAHSNNHYEDNAGAAIPGS